MRYYVDIPVTAVSGFQTYSVEADSPADALSLFKQGFGPFLFEEEEVEVTTLGVDKITNSDEFYLGDEE